MDDLSFYVPNVHFEQIPIKNLVSNQDYQRNLSQAHIERAAAHFALYQINPVKVSRRDGINYVFNGQHTIEIQLCVIKNCPLYPYRMDTQTKASLQTSDGCSGKSLQE